MVPAGAGRDRTQATTRQRKTRRMNDLFGVDSPLTRVLTKIADLMIANLLFIVTSLPVITIGAAVTALNYTTMKILRDEQTSIVKDYWRSFRENFKQATVLWGIVVLLGAVMAAWYLVVDKLIQPGALRVGLWVVFYLILFRLVMAVVWLFALQSKFVNTVRETLRNARLLPIRHLFTTVMVLIVTTLPVVVTVFYPKAVGYGLAWLLIGFSGVCFLNSIFLNAVFRKYVPDEALVPGQG